MATLPGPGFILIAGDATSGSTAALTAALSAAGQIQAVAGSYSYTNTTTSGTPDAQGLKTLTLIISNTAPNPIGAAIGGHIYYEYPDQSQTDDFTLDGSSSPLDGASTSTNGTWKPVDAGKFPFNADGSPWDVKGLKVPAGNVNIRVYVSTYTANSDPAPVRATLPGATPNCVIDVIPPVTGASGVEYALNVTQAKDSNGNLLPFVSAAAAVSGGTNVTTLAANFLPASDPRWAGVELNVRHPNGEDEVLAIFAKVGSVQIVTPAIQETDVVYLVSFSTKPAEVSASGQTGGRAVNSIVPGLTPSSTVVVGTTGGTLSLGQGVPASLASALAILGAVLGVPNQGITESLVANFAIANQQLALVAVATGNLQNGSVSTTKVASANITTALIAGAAITTALVGNAQITTALIANGAITNLLVSNLDAGKITTGTLSAIAISAVTITASTMTLNSGGVTTALANLSFIGAVAGLTVTQNSTGEMVGLTPAFLEFLDSAGGAIAICGNFGYGLVTLGVLGNPDVVVLSADGGSGQLYLGGTAQIQVGYSTGYNGTLAAAISAGKSVVAGIIVN